MPSSRPGPSTPHARSVLTQSARSPRRWTRSAASARWETGAAQSSIRDRRRPDRPCRPMPSRGGPRRTAAMGRAPKPAQAIGLPHRADAPGSRPRLPASEPGRRSAPACRPLQPAATHDRDHAAEPRRIHARRAVPSTRRRARAAGHSPALFGECFRGHRAPGCIRRGAIANTFGIACQVRRRASSSISLSPARACRLRRRVIEGVSPKAPR